MPVPVRAFRMVAVASPKGGVGKTTFASNLAVTVRALHEDLPVLVLGLDAERSLDRVFGLEPEPRRPTIAEALRAGDLASAIRLGRYGVHFAPCDPGLDACPLDRPDLGGALVRAGWRGLVVADTRSDLGPLTRDALAASDLAVVLVKDTSSLDGADRVFALLDSWGRGAEHSRALFSLVDHRVRFGEGAERDVLAVLLAALRRRGRPHFAAFLSRSPAVEALATNPQSRVLPVLTGAPRSRVHRELRGVTEEVLAALGGPDALAPRALATGPAWASAPAAGPPQAATGWSGGSGRDFHRWILAASRASAARS